jgi:DNA-directed RNA polymerase subunit RPC12/RpoP
MTVEMTSKPVSPPNPSFKSGCRGCGARFSFDQRDCEVEYRFPNHTLTLACPGCGARLVWTLPPLGLQEA